MRRTLLHATPQTPQTAVQTPRETLTLEVATWKNMTILPAKIERWNEAVEA